MKGRHAKRHTAEIIAPLSYGSLEAHRNEPWRRRSADYESAKNRITKALLDFVELHRPGFADLVEYSELATPLTFEHFTAAPSGTIYGYPATPERYGKEWLGPRTPIQNLYLTGSDAALLGIMGALMGGVLTASLLLGSFGFLEIMRAARSRSCEPGSQHRIIEAPCPIWHRPASLQLCPDHDPVGINSSEQDDGETLLASWHAKWPVVS